MPGVLKEESIIIDDPVEGSQIYNKGFYGYPLSGGGLELDLLEACYLVETGRLVVQQKSSAMNLEEVMRRAARIYNDFEIDYLVYRDLRQRGYIVKRGADDFDFRVFPRGGTPSSSATKFWVMSITERSSFNIESFREAVERSEKTRKELLVAVVDEEGDITYYKASAIDPQGHVIARDERDEVVEATLFEDRALIFDRTAVEYLYDREFYGKKIGDALQLSMIETAFLLEKGRISLKSARSGKRIGLKGLKRRARNIQMDFDIRFSVYSDLRSRGLVVKTGFKYGSHFRVYDADPGKHHSRYLVHAIPENYEASWPEISRAVRLAHGVKKEILLARTTKYGVEYLRLKRVRP
ncbi:MAG: tRNA-intron lyase [Methanomassiliicoccales archaeon]